MTQPPASSESKRESREARAVARWRPARNWYHPLLAAIVVKGSQFIMRRMNTLTIEGRERFDALAERHGRGLLTFSNHVSLFDDPLLPANFAPSGYDEMRWVASDALNFFGTGWRAWIFTAGKCVPVVRGAGVGQDGFHFLSDRLAAGAWIHIFPEGGRTRDSRGLMQAPFKLGIGRLIDEAHPIALPFYHHGMQSVLPVGSSRPRAGQRVQLRFGNPTSCDEAFVAATVANARSSNERDRWEALSRWAHEELRELELRVHPAAREEDIVGIH